MEEGAEIMTAAERTLQCVVVTPEATVLETAATFVALPLFDGEIGIAPLHSPMIGRLSYGEMRVVQPTGTRVYYVDGGFVQIVEDRVSVLTNRAVAAEEVDAEVAAEQLSSAWQVPAYGDQRIAIRDRQVAQARAQMRVARGRDLGQH